MGNTSSSQPWIESSSSPRANICLPLEIYKETTTSPLDSKVKYFYKFSSLEDFSLVASRIFFICQLTRLAYHSFFRKKRCFFLFLKSCLSLPRHFVPAILSIFLQLSDLMKCFSPIWLNLIYYLLGIFRFPF